MRTCPFSAIVVDGPLLVAPRTDAEQAHPVDLLGDVSEIRSGFAGWPEALAEADRCLQCPDPTCMRGCPAHNDIPGFIAAIRNRDLEGAHEILRRTSVLPDICSRVCNQAAQCEGACSWSLAGGVPVAIGRLERFVTDKLPVPPPAPATGDRRAVSGDHRFRSRREQALPGSSSRQVPRSPSTRRTQRQAACATGGFPTSPSLRRLPLGHGASSSKPALTCAVAPSIHPEDLDRLLGSHDAVIVAHGAPVPLRLSVPGAELDGVTDATTFLQGAKTALEEGGDTGGFLATLGLASRDVEPGRRLPKVLVLGAGNTAMDVARTARRLRLEATCVDWLDERFALTRPDELEEARHEGVEVRFLRTLTALRGDGRASHSRRARPHDPRQGRSPPHSSQRRSRGPQRRPRRHGDGLPGGPGVRRRPSWHARASGGRRRGQPAVERERHPQLYSLGLR